MARISARGRASQRFVDQAAADHPLYAVQAARLLDAMPGKGPPAVSPPASIIPSPGPLPGPVNATQIISVDGITYTLAQGAYLYADQLAILVRSDTPSNNVDTVINRGTMWNDTAVQGPTTINVASGQTFENYGLMVANADVFAGYDPYNRQHAVALTSDNILNRGQIFALATNGNAIGLRSMHPQYLQTNMITNSGLIAVRAPEGNAVGMFLDGRLINEAGGQILAEGFNAIAVQFRNALVPYVPDPINGGYMSVDLINNAGLIQAVSTEPGLGSVAIRLAHSGDYPDVRYTAYVVNSGTIRADYAIITDNLAISTSVAHSIEYIRNLAGGLIDGDILLDRGLDTIENSGTIRGFVSMGEGNDLFDTRNGVFEGYADLFWGDDKFLGSAGTDIVTGENGDDRIEGNGGHDLLLGGGNDDVLIGGAGNDGLFGEYGNDRIVTQGGDFVWGGAGNDRVELGDYTFELVDGNEGFDTLVLPGGARIFDLSLALAEQAIAGFEAIVLGGDKELVVRAADIPLISDGGSTLRLTGLASDRIDLVGAWVAGGTQLIDGISWRRFDLDGRTVLVEGPATVAIAASGAAGAVGLDPFAGGTPAPVPGDEAGVGFTPIEFYLSGYYVAEAIVCNEEELWWNDAGFHPVLYMNDLGCDLTNYGTIAKISETDYPFAHAVQGLAFGSLDNYGTIAAIWTWDGPFQPSDENGISQTIAVHHIGTVVNDGLITAEALHGRVYGALLQGHLTNNGEIYARSEHGYAVGVLEPGILVNHGLVLAIGGLAASGVRTRAELNNEGRIEAHMVTPGSGESIGIETYFGSSTSQIIVRNSGTVIADIAVGQPMDLNYSSYGAVNLINSGLLDGRVELSLVNDRITNIGTITGAVRLFDGDDVFDGVNGTQSGLIDGGIGNDTLTGGAGADILKGGLGADILDGKGGADRFLYQAAAESTAASMDRIRAFQSGLDRIDLTALAPSSLSWTEATDADGLYSLVSVVTAGGTMTIRVDGPVATSDFLVAPPLNLIGTAAGDTLTGGPGDDMLDGAGGADTLSGGRGNDTYIVDTASDLVHEMAGEGTDLVYTSVSYALGAGEEVEILSTRAHGGTDAINLFGNGFAQTLVGNAGANFIDGRGGADVMAGLAGDDLYIVDNAGDQILEGIGQGNDSIVTSVSFVLSSNQEIETLSTQTHAGTDDLFLTGNQLNNTLIGNAGDNLLNGVGGADVMIGLDGDDTYAIDDAGDLVIDLENQGNDLVLTYLSHTLTNGNQIETLSTVFHQGTTAIDLGGNDYDNTLIGNYGANYINGNGGADTMIGLNGDDTYVADNAADQVLEDAGGGADVLFSFVSYTLAAGQEVETISTAVQGGTGAINLTGNEIAQTIIGNAGANLIDGKSGSDTLYGLGGADTFAFTSTLGAGNVDTIADFVTGTDRIGLDDAIFTAIGGTLGASAFVIGTAAGDADDRIIYNSATGALLYDADGAGGAGAVQFATLSTGLALTASDFLVI